MMDLPSKLNETSNLSRLNAVDAAYAGSPYAGTNFNAKWQGYDADGNSLVKYQGDTYTARQLSMHSILANTSVVLRVARGVRFVNY